MDQPTYKTTYHRSPFNGGVTYFPDSDDISEFPVITGYYPAPLFEEDCQEWKTDCTGNDIFETFEAAYDAAYKVCFPA